MLLGLGICTPDIGCNNPALWGTMKNSIKLGLSATGLIAGNGSAQAQSNGHWVLAQYKGGNYWYPGVIQAIFGGNFTVGLRRWRAGDTHRQCGEAVRPDYRRPS